ncbi:hypothetical protein AWN76_013150 [Rhodothermaceae bacterium RA]|nr:hypothetical protein AWN76_013150 [Rhodothermaceae bacterium RA]
MMRPWIRAGLLVFWSLCGSVLPALAQSVPTEGLRLWLKADALAGLADGDAVAVWPDASGGANDATQPDTARQPTYRTGVVGGLPALRFDGVDDYLDVAALVDDLQAGTGLTVVFVASGTGRGYVFSAHTSGGSNLALFGYSDDGVYEVFKGYGVTAPVPSGEPAAYVNVWTSRATSSADTTIRTWRNGGALLEGRLGAVEPDKIGRVSIGQEYDGASATDFLDGDIAEILVYDRVIDTAERLQIEAYLLDRYGFDLSPDAVTAPIFTRAPTDTTLQVGQSVALDVRALDPHGNDATLTLAASDLPPGLMFTDDGGGQGRLTGTLTTADAGTYRVEIRATDQDGEVTTHTFVLIVPRPIALDSTTEDSLRLHLDDWFRFDGAAGTVVTLRFHGPGFSTWTHLDVIGPDGTPLLGTRGASTVHLGPFALPETGAYAVRVFHTNNGAGPYRLGLATVEAPTPITPAAPFVDLTGTVTILGQHVYYQFDGSAGDVHRFFFQTPDPLGGGTLRLRGPGDAPFYERPVLASINASTFYKEAVSGRITLPEDGSYVLEFVPTGGGTGAFDLRLFRFEAVPYTLGEEVAGTITEPYTIDRYRFDGAAGDVIRVWTVNESVGSYLYTRVYGPDGAELAEVRSSSGAAEAVVTLPEDGSYVIEQAPSGRATGSYRFRAFREATPQPIAGAVPWTEVAGRIDVPGQNAYYRFDGAAGQIVAVDLFVPDTSALRGSLRLYREGASYLEGPIVDDPHERRAEGAFSSGGPAILTAALPEDGTYILQVDGSTAEAFATGSYTLRFGLVDPAPVVTVGLDAASPEVVTGFPRAGARAVQAGGLVRIEAGTYEVWRRLLITAPGVRIEGAGPEATTIEKNGSVAVYGYSIFEIAAEDVALRDLHLETINLSRAVYLGSSSDAAARAHRFTMEGVRVTGYYLGVGQGNGRPHDDVAIRASVFDLSAVSGYGVTALRLEGDRIRVEDNRFATAPGTRLDVGVEIAGDAALVQNNRFGAEEAPSPAEQTVGRAVIVRGNAARILDNALDSVSGDGIVVDARSAPADTATVQGNRIRGRGTSAIRLQSVARARVEANYVPGYGNWQQGIDLVESGGWVINNRVALQDRTAYRYVSTSATPPEAVLANNASRHAGLLAVSRGVQVQASNATTAPVRIINHIAAAPATTAGSIALESDVPVAEADYNLIHGFDAAHGGALTPGLHDRFGDPLFADEAFALQDASPAIDAGTADGAPPTDYRGTARPLGGGVDIGPYESAATGASGQVTFLVDLAQMERLGLFDPAVADVYVEIFSGSLPGRHRMARVDTSLSYRVQTAVLEGETIHYGFLFDPDGQGTPSTFIYELQGHDGARTFTMPGSDPQALPPAFFDDVPPAEEALAPAAVVTHAFRPGNPGRVSFHGPDGLDTDVDLDFSSLDRAAVVSVRRYEADPGGTPPAGIATVSSQAYWGVHIVPRQAAYAVEVQLSYARLTGIADENDLRLLRRANAADAWTTVPTSINAPANVATAVTSSLSEWTVGSVSERNPLVARAPGVASSPDPEDGAVIAPNAEAIDFSWAPVPDATSYDLYLWPIDEPRPEAPAQAGLTVALARGVPVAADVSYYWQILARNRYGATWGPRWTVVLAPQPDLVVTDIQVPVEVFSGQTMAVEWTVTNVGAGGTTMLGWHDYVVLSPDTTIDQVSSGGATASDGFLALGDLLVGQKVNATSLDPGQSYTNSVTFDVPDGISGTFYVFVQADNGFRNRNGSFGRNQVREANEENNRARVPLEVVLTPPPDLQVTELVVPPGPSPARRWGWNGPWKTSVRARRTSPAGTTASTCLRTACWTGTWRPAASWTRAWARPGTAACWSRVAT